MQKLIIFGSRYQFASCADGKNVYNKLTQEEKKRRKTMKVYIIRHGQSEANLLDNNAGWAPVELSALGREQAAQAGRHLRGIVFDRVYCSDLRRAQQTAQLALPGCELILSDKLREVGVGILAGKPIRENEIKYGDVYARSVKEQDFSAFGGETQESIRSRVASFMQELEALQDVAKVAVFGHEGTVHQMVSYALGSRILLEHFQIDNASCTVLAYEDGIWRVVKFNDTGTLE